MATTRPRAIATSATSSRPDSGSITRPPRRIRSAAEDSLTRYSCPCSTAPIQLPVLNCPDPTARAQLPVLNGPGSLRRWSEQRQLARDLVNLASGRRADGTARRGALRDLRPARVVDHLHRQAGRAGPVRQRKKFLLAGHLQHYLRLTAPHPPPAA